MTDGVTAYETELAVFPAELLLQDRWFTWAYDEGRKIPRAPWLDGSGANEWQSWKDPDVWTDFDTADEWVDKITRLNHASCIPPRDQNTEERVVFFDFDNCRDPETGAIHPHAWAFIVGEEREPMHGAISTSGTGVHGYCWASIPEGYKPSFEIELDEWEHSDTFDEEPSMEVYAEDRFLGLTGEHITQTPVGLPELSDMVHEIFARYGDEQTVSTEREPDVSRDEVQAMDVTTDVDDVYDAISLTRPSDIRLRSTVTEERADGSVSMDPAWEQSDSGTRLARFDDHWLYRKGNHRLDALQVVALEERIISDPADYPSGDEFVDAVEALRQRGASIPKLKTYDLSGGDAERPSAEPDGGTTAAPSDDTEAASGRSEADDDAPDDADAVDGLREQFRGHEQREIVEQLRGRNTVSKDQMGGPDGAVLTANCVLEIGRDEIDTRTPSPEDEFMARVETEFDPQAECPRWRAFLNEVLPKGSDRKKVQEFAGYMLHHWGLPHHKALFLVGPTASGKSTLLDTLRAMLGSDSVAALTPQQMAGERFSGAELRGAWANIRNDIPANLIENVGQLKEIIGGDPIKAERKRKDPFMFEPTAKHAFSANQLPDAEVNDEAFFRRILLVPVPDTVPRGERDPALDDKLQAELPGILNWALDGLQRLFKQGRFTADRDPGETQRTWEKWGHSIDRFRETCLEEASGDAIPKADLYSAYVDFCDDEGIPVSSQHKMTRQLKRSGLEDGRQSVDGERQRCILGVDWSSRGEQYAPDDSGDGRPSGLGEH